MSGQDGSDDPLDALRDRIRETTEAAERLMADAKQRVPAGGWASETPGADGAFSEEVQALAALLQSLRDLLPPELREQVTDLVRQLLLVLRALIDWWVAQIERPPADPAPDVQDITIA